MSVMAPMILSKLHGVQRAGEDWLAFCPAHADRAKRSLSIKVESGRVLLHCFVGCTAEQVVAAVGHRLADLFEERRHGAEGDGRAIVATYDYRDEAGTLLYQIVRSEPKDFRIRRPDGVGGWTWKLGEVRRIVYRLQDLAECRTAVYVEGEKDADRLWALGIPATTHAGGAKGFDKRAADYAAQLRAAGVERLVCCPDNDDAGRSLMQAVAIAARSAGLTVRWLALTVPVKGDVSDWLDAGHTPEELGALMAEAPAFTTAAPRPPDVGAPGLDAEGDDYRVRWPDGVSVATVALRESGEGIHAEATVSVHGEVLSWGRLNLASTSMREGLVRKLREAAPTVAWRERLELACRLIVERVREGAPLVVLRPRPRAADQQNLIEDMLPIGETSLVYADGDTGKGWLALLIAVALVTGQAFPNLRPTRRGLRIAYLDWESTEDELAARVDGVCRAAGLTLPPGMILYRAMSRALAEEAPRLRLDFARHGVEFVIVDSLAPACGIEPESADSTIRAMNALRSFPGTTRLVLAHLSKASADQSVGATRPYGSVFVRNLARSAWELRRAEETEPDELVLAAYHRKHNVGRRSPPFSLRLTFQSDGAVMVSKADLAEAPDLLARASLSKRVTVALATGALTIAELAEHLNAVEATVGRIIRRLRDKGRVVQVGGDTRPSRWGLAVR